MKIKKVQEKEGSRRERVRVIRFSLDTHSFIALSGSGDDKTDAAQSPRAVSDQRGLINTTVPAEE